jgi:hypothetical protein
VKGGGANSSAFARPGSPRARVRSLGPCVAVVDLPRIVSVRRGVASGRPLSTAIHRRPVSGRRVRSIGRRSCRRVSIGRGSFGGLVRVGGRLAVWAGRKSAIRGPPPAHAGGSRATRGTPSSSAIAGASTVDRCPARRRAIRAAGRRPGPRPAAVRRVRMGRRRGRCGLPVEFGAAAGDAPPAGARARSVAPKAMKRRRRTPRCRRGPRPREYGRPCRGGSGHGHGPHSGRVSRVPRATMLTAPPTRMLYSASGRPCGRTVSRLGRPVKRPCRRVNSSSTGTRRCRAR